MNKEVEKIYKRKIKEIQKHNKLYYDIKHKKPMTNHVLFDLTLIERVKTCPGATGGGLLVNP